MSGPLVPDYGNSTLADLLPSLGAHLGIAGATDTLQLPAAARYVVLLVDGLGATLLADAAEHAPFLAGHAARSFTCGVPSTTATSITSLGTGLTPGQHGVAGYTFRYGGSLLNALLWDERVDGLDVQPQLTYLERLTKAGVTTSSVTPARFRNSGLTTCALRGPSFLDVVDEADLDLRAALTMQGATTGERSLVYSYERHLDHVGHAQGVASTAWLAELTRIDGFAARLRAELPDEVSLLVTGDHGMVDVPAASRTVIEERPELTAGVRLIGGEPRFRQLYVRPGATDDVAAAWAASLGDQALVCTRDEAIAAGWFGPTGPRLADRFGDVLAAARGDAAFMTTTQPKEFTLVGMHGSLSEAEMLVPLVVA